MILTCRNTRCVAPLGSDSATLTGAPLPYSSKLMPKKNGVKTGKKLLIGAVALLAVVISTQAYPNAIVIDSEGNRKMIDMAEYTDWGSSRPWYVPDIWREFGGTARHSHNYKSIELPAFLRSVVEIDLSRNALTNLVIPLGMVSLRRIDLRGNIDLTNLVLQQDTGVVGFDDGWPDVSPTERNLRAVIRKIWKMFHCGRCLRQGGRAGRFIIWESHG